MDISTMMLQVLDDPAGVRIIVKTKYPNLADEGENAYLMIDRSNGGGAQKVDENGNPMFDEKHNPVWEDSEIYDCWKVYDSIGQSKEFKFNVDLIEFLDSIEDVITGAWVESF